MRSDKLSCWLLCKELVDLVLRARYPTMELSYISILGEPREQRNRDHSKLFIFVISSNKMTIKVMFQ